MSGCTAPEILRSEAYLSYVAATRDTGVTPQMGVWGQPREGNPPLVILVAAVGIASLFLNRPSRDETRLMKTFFLCALCVLCGSIFIVIVVILRGTEPQETIQGIM